MLVIFGLKNSTSVLGTGQTNCPHCGALAAQRVDRLRRSFSVFFVPLIPLGTRYVVTCTACGLSTKIDSSDADRLLARAR